MQEQLKQKGPEPAESFDIEFLNQCGTEIQRAMSALGFVFRRSKPGEDKTEVYFEGERSNGDGTKINITITKGAKYKSPAEIEKEQEEKEKKE